MYEDLPEPLVEFSVHIDNNRLCLIGGLGLDENGFGELRNSVFCTTEYTSNILGGNGRDLGDIPTKSPSKRPTSNPTKRPTTRQPTRRPTQNPTRRPTFGNPTDNPTRNPTVRPSEGKIIFFVCKNKGNSYMDSSI